MKISENIGLIEYTKKQELCNALTHALGAAFGVTGLIICIVKAGRGNARYFISAIVYCLSFILVYTASALYHGMPQGDKKRFFRLFDHVAIPVLLAGTTTPCALITLYRVSPPHGIAVFCTGWFIALFGIITKVFFFNNEKMKIACMSVYFIGGAAMLFSAIPKLGNINITGFCLLCAGCAAYIIGAIICKLGVKRPRLHTVFHIFVLAGSIIHFIAIYRFVFRF